MNAREIGVEVHEVRGGWMATVTIAEGSTSTRHRVHILAGELERFAPGATPEAFVRASFAFLLDRESKESILREFEIGVIARYFPEYEREIRRSMRN